MTDSPTVGLDTHALADPAGTVAAALDLGCQLSGTALKGSLGRIGGDRRTHEEF